MKQDMDFSNRGAQSQTTVPSAPTVASGNSSNSHRNKPDRNKLSRITTVILVVSVAILLSAVIAVAASGTKQESGYVDSSKLQAVFLNTGQVYFGNIRVLNSRYFVVSNIYYLQTSNSGSAASDNSAANNKVTLVKLGCELHEPYDQMVINSSQVTFWENLQDNGQVAKAVATFEKQNPNGQKCADQSASSSPTSNSVQSANPNAAAKP